MLLDKLSEVLYQSGLQSSKVTYCVWGKHGIGKTQIVEQVATKLGYGFRNIRLSQIDPTELIGFPKSRTTKIEIDGKEEEIEYLDYNPPKWYVDAMRGNYIIFLDELNRAKRDVIQAAFELVNERRLNGRQLPDSTLIVVACNPPSAKYDTIEMDEALVDRFCHIHVHSNYEVFTNWAKSKQTSDKKQRIDQNILNFLSIDKSRQTFDMTDEEDRQFPVVCKPSPRSWEKVDQVFNLKLARDTRQELVAGIVGSEISMNFFNSLGQGNKPITLDELFSMNLKDENDEVAERVKSYSRVGEDVIKGGKANLGETGEQIVELALLSHTCEDLVRDENRDEVKNNYQKVFQFLTMIPADMAQKTLKRLCNKRSDKTFWEENLGEPKKDSKGHPVEGQYVWQKLIDGLEDLATARENLNPVIAQSKPKK